MTWQTSAWRAPMARNQRLESNAMSEWCFQCGVDSKPERAVGWDEDGEPACALHRVKAARPFNLPAPVALPPVMAEPMVVKVKPAAAPSPVQTSAKEKVMIPQKKCACGCGIIFEPTGNRQIYAPGHKPTRSKKVRSETVVVATKKPSKIRKNGDGSFTMTVKTPHSLPLGSGSAESVFGANRFTAGQLDRIWALLSAASKAEAIDRLLSYTAL
jgi:hypothetical protein